MSGHSYRPLCSKLLLVNAHSLFITWKHLVFLKCTSVSVLVTTCTYADGFLLDFLRIRDDGFCGTVIRVGQEGQNKLF